ncbi:hypothetical protein ASPZODRAFT_12944 [Penicilliopsis zonata CBS 506.65]|uniref:Uncharacterized protein n=1 Tax=Penicilliopsis zonata CBS 506.65 TaxID=1073090 RepID=A0A1L9SRJ2_9EURO|nr:hypothetical protein ASPZODRAFT_12944 [Penicilliopsis zonata CBS 506.65]OJJ49832.1 hypothetical protein ASPZODRAFT_12944 [Penicilliopsis zonata CBS 506.65]
MKRPQDVPEPSSLVSLPKRTRIPPSSLRSSSDSVAPSSITTSNDLSEETTGDGDGDGDEDDEDDYTSSEGSTSSSESESNADDEDLDHHDDVVGSPEEESTSITNVVPSRSKPSIGRITLDSDILARVSSFLPQLRSANEALQKDIAAGKSKDILLDEAGEEEGQYIEMNLGLGVLEETQSNDDHENSSSPDLDRETESATTKQTTDAKESHIMDSLMGHKEEKPTKPTIEEMEE